jgi:hypothetical protein
MVCRGRQQRVPGAAGLETVFDATRRRGWTWVMKPVRIIFGNGGECTMVKERLIVIGGDAAGMSAASQARRRRPDLEIVAFERSPHTSYSA